MRTPGSTLPYATVGGTSRRGRATSSPPQFGQRRFIASAQAAQKVHSKLQIKASPSIASPSSQRSQAGFICNAIGHPFRTLENITWPAETTPQSGLPKMFENPGVNENGPYFVSLNSSRPISMRRISLVPAPIS